MGIHRFFATCSQFVKQSIFSRYIPSNSLCIETGTFQGESTDFLSRRVLKVISIEPSDKYYQAARHRFSGFPNVELVNATSEDILEKLLAQQVGQYQHISFWLDGHYSGGETFKSSRVSPLEEELNSIQKFIKDFESITILIDDARLFIESGAQRDPGYPTLEVVHNWAVKHGFEFRLEMDIFILSRN